MDTLLAEKREWSVAELKKLMRIQKMWVLRKSILDAHIFALEGKVKTPEQEIDAILMEKIRKK